MISSVGVNMGHLKKYQFPLSPIYNIIHNLPESEMIGSHIIDLLPRAGTYIQYYWSSQHQKPGFTSHYIPGVVSGYTHHSGLTITLYYRGSSLSHGIMSNNLFRSTMSAQIPTQAAAALKMSWVLTMYQEQFKALCVHLCGCVWKREREKERVYF